MAVHVPDQQKERQSSLSKIEPFLLNNVYYGVGLWAYQLLLVIR